MSAPSPAPRGAVVLHASPFSTTPSRSAGRSALQQEYTYGDDEEDQHSPAAAAASAGPVAAAGQAPIEEDDMVRIHQPAAAANNGLDVNYDPASATRAPPLDHEHDLDRDLENGSAGGGVSGNNHRRNSLSIIVDGGGAPTPARKDSTMPTGIETKTMSPLAITNATKVPIPVPVRTLARVSSGDTIAHPYGWYMSMLLILSYTVLFIVEFGSARDGQAWEMESWYVNPSGGPSYKQLDRLGGKSTFKILGLPNLGTGSDRSQGWRLITSVFWHSGVVTFLPAMIGIAWVGRLLEREYGPLRILVLWFLCGIFGTMFSAIMSVDLLSVSATAGLFGLFGARLFDLYAYRDWYSARHVVCNVLSTLLAMGVGLVLGLLPLVDNWAHLGGMIMGALGGGVLFTGGWRESPAHELVGEPNSNITASRENLDRTRRYTKTRIVCIALIVISWVVVIGLLFGAVKRGMKTTSVSTGRGITFGMRKITSVWCADCNKFQCVDTSAWTCRPSYYD